MLIFGLIVPGFMAWRSTQLIEANSQWIVLSRWYAFRSISRGPTGFVNPKMVLSIRYQPQANFWEVVIIGRKLLMVVSNEVCPRTNLVKFYHSFMHDVFAKVIRFVPLQYMFVIELYCCRKYRKSLLK